jgi:hypothetical protein
VNCCCAGCDFCDAFDRLGGFGNSYIGSVLLFSTFPVVRGNENGGLLKFKPSKRCIANLPLTTFYGTELPRCRSKSAMSLRELGSWVGRGLQRGQIPCSNPHSAKTMDFNLEGDCRTVPLKIQPTSRRRLTAHLSRLRRGLWRKSPSKVVRLAI